MKEFLTGMTCACRGFQDLFHPKIRHYVYIPLIINLLIFGLLFYFGINYISNWDFSSYDLPSWLSWLSGAMAFIDWILKAILYVLLFIVLALLSSFGANLIASPFNSLLSEAFAKTLGHQTTQTNFLSMISASLSREASKFVYYLPRACIMGLACFILYFIPGLNLLIPGIFFGFSSWMLAIQYIDYPADNNQIAFKIFLEKIKQRKIACFSFGLIIAAGSTLPVINFIIMPAAVLGATRLYYKIK